MTHTDVVLTFCLQGAPTPSVIVTPHPQSWIIRDREVGFKNLALTTGCPKKRSPADSFTCFGVSSSLDRRAHVRGCDEKQNSRGRRKKLSKWPMKGAGFPQPIKSPSCKIVEVQFIQFCVRKRAVITVCLKLQGGLTSASLPLNCNSDRS